MRNRLWMWATKRLPEGCLLPWWAVVIRAILYPLDFFYWKMSGSRGYQPQTDTWIIEGVRFSRRGLAYLLRADDWVFRVKRRGNHLELTRIINHPEDSGRGDAMPK